MTGNHRFPIGTNVMSYWDRKLEAGVPLLASMGFDAVEIWTEHFWKFGEDPQQIGNLARQLNLLVSVHCPIMDVNITSPNAGIRKESVKQVLESIEIAQKVGASTVVLHPGCVFTLMDPIDTYWKFQMDAFEQFVALASKLKVHIAVENMDVQNKVEVVKTSADIHRITSHFGPDELDVVLDVTHLGITERVLEFIRLTDHITHVHLSDAYIAATGETMTHLPLGEGKLDFPAIISALKLKSPGIISLETFIPPGNPEKIRAQRAFVESML
jgi:sugar phosphate isomerase/epimerase